MRRLLTAGPTCQQMDWHPASTCCDKVLRSGLAACKPWKRVIFCRKSCTCLQSKTTRAGATTRWLANMEPAQHPPLLQASTTHALIDLALELVEWVLPRHAASQLLWKRCLTLLPSCEGVNWGARAHQLLHGPDLCCAATQRWPRGASQARPRVQPYCVGCP